MWQTYLIDLKSIPYRQAHEVMLSLVRWKQARQTPQVLILAEHEPVITLGRRSGEDDFIVSEACLRREGIGVYRIERGGLATYHGPGQLVAYPVFNLHQMNLGVVQLVSGLEQAVIDTLAIFGISGESRPNFRGVWVGTEKIASVGIAVRRGVSFHGIALNVAPNLDHFKMIHPCGIPNVQMASMTRLLNCPIDPFAVRKRFAASLTDVFKLSFETITLEQLQKKTNFQIASEERGSLHPRKMVL